MTDPTTLLVVAAVALAGLAMLVTASLAGWRGWLALKGRQLDLQHAVPGTPGVGARIEIADLRERIRKLEAIAAGVEL